MNYIAGILILFISLTGHAFEIKVRKMLLENGMDRSFVFKTQLQDRVVLDCQSFIQGLRIGKDSDVTYFIMGPEECESLQGRVRSSLRRFQRHCIDVEEEIRADYTCQ